MSALTGILDNSTQQVVVLNDDNVILRGNVKIHGVLDVGLVRTTEIIADSRYEKKFLTFIPPEDGSIAGTGLLWSQKNQPTKELVFRTNPDCFFLSEHVDIPTDKGYLIGSFPVLTIDTLGGSVTESNLRSVGSLKSLTVDGNVNFADYLFFSPTSRKFSIGRQDSSALFTLYDQENDVEIILEGNRAGQAKLGTFNNRGVDLVTGNQTRLSISPNGSITLGQENNSNTAINLFGKFGVNIKNPQEDLEVAGNIKFRNKLFGTGNTEPNSGFYQRGDIIWNDDPMVNNYIGWVCILSGNPGRWAPFGLIAG
jgi:hypothetical protein